MKKSNQFIKLALAEDHPMLRKSLVAFLSLKNNIQVVVQAENGQELLDKLKTSKVDIVILDIQMPVLDGIATLKQLKSDYPNSKVIMFSTWYNNHTITKLKKMGANACVSKSEPEKLLNSIYSLS